MNPGKKINHEIVFNAFGRKTPNPFMRTKVIKEIAGLGLGPQLDLDIFLALKILVYIKELTEKMEVKDFFSSRFKRKLVKKSIIEKLQTKIEKYISKTTLEKRN